MLEVLYESSMKSIVCGLPHNLKNLTLDTCVSSLPPSYKMDATYIYILLALRLHNSRMWDSGLTVADCVRERLFHDTSSLGFDYGWKWGAWENKESLEDRCPWVSKIEARGRVL